MHKTATLTPIQLAAQLCCRLYTSPLKKTLISEEGLAAIQSVLGSPMSADDIILFGTKLRQSDNFAETQENFINQWRHRMDSEQVLNEQDAQTFMQELFGKLDHAILFDHDITANSSLHERDHISDSEMQYPGNMPCWTLHLTLHGNALFLNDQMEVSVGRGDLMLFHPDARYHCGIHPSAQSWEHLWALFQPRPHWNEWLEWSALDDGILHLSLTDENSCTLVESLFRQLVALKDEAGPYQSDLRYNRLEEILIRATEFSSRAERKTIDQRILCACDYIQAHLTEKFSVDDIATACNLSPSRLAHLFKQHMGVSPKSWGNNIRLQRARKLLLGSSDSIGLVAREVGYEDPTQFTKYFKKNMGCSPKQFRQEFSASN